VSINTWEFSLDQQDYTVAIIKENTLVSHRGLFQDYLDHLQGVILHLGNPCYVEDKESSFFAGDLIDWDFEGKKVLFPVFEKEKATSGTGQSFVFQFLAEYHVEINALLVQAMKYSPVDQVVFLTDFQMGPAREKHVALETVEELWRIHHSQGLSWNTAYIIGRDNADDK
jgi:hypothetical protein